MNFAIKTILAISLILFTVIQTQLIGQNHFSRLYHFDIGDDNYPGDFVITDEEIISAVRHVCPNQTRCTSLLSFDLNGDVKRNKLIEELDVGNENAIHLENDSIVVSGHVLFGDRSHTGFLRASMDFSTWTYREIDVGSNIDIITNDGLLRHRSNYYTWGDGRFVGADTVFGYVAKWNVPLTELVDVFYYNQDNGANHIYDLQAHPNGNLVFFNPSRAQGVHQNDHNRIVEIDTNGSIVRDFDRVYNTSKNHYPGFKLLTNDTYVYARSPESHEGDFRREFIVNIDPTTHEEIWRLELPFEYGFDGRGYSVYDIEQTDNGDILICGELFDYYDVFAEDNTSFYCGFMARIDSESGELHWLRYYPMKNYIDVEDNGPYKYSRLEIVEEMDNGDILAMGLADELRVDEIRKRELWVLRVGADGCLYDENCTDEELLITATENIKPDDSSAFDIFPNPTRNSFQIFGDKEVRKVELFDISGKRIFKKDNCQIIDAGHLAPGIYLLHIYDRDGFLTIKKIIRN